MTGKKSHKKYLPRKFILVLKISNLGQVSRCPLIKMKCGFLLRFKIFSSFRLKGEHISDILFLVIKDKVRIKLHKLTQALKKKQSTIFKNSIKAHLLTFKLIAKI